MSTFGLQTADVRDAFRRREIKRVVYMHCDHWEPWRAIPGEKSVVNARCRDEALRFVELSGKSDLTSRLTLFYKPNINYIYDHEPTQMPGLKVDPSDGVRFVVPSAQIKQISSEALGGVAASGMDVQVHIHHEHITYNTDHKKPEVAAFIGTPEARAREEARFALLLRLALNDIREDTGRPLDGWFFVHGHWALNASDPSVCHLTRELAILMEQGCLGDFTVPSGRPVVNPRLELPYFITPVDAPKGYDLQAGEPELAYGNRTARQRGKFLIWSSVIKHRGASLDYFAPWVAKRLETPASLALEIVEQSYAVDGTLFVKTHAHSLHPNYYIDTDRAVFPHQHSPIQALFALLLEAAAAADCAVEFRTVSEVYEMFTSAAYAPAGGFALTMPGPPPVIDACVPADRALDLRTRIVTLPPVAPAREAVLDLDTLVSDVRPRPSPDVPTTVTPAPPLSPNACSLTAIPHGALIGLAARNVAMQMLAEVGSEQLGSTIAARADRWSFLLEHEARLVAYVRGLDRRFRSHHDVGCGLGTLSLGFAAAGLASVGMDARAPAISGARRLSERVARLLAGQKQSLAAPCTFIHGRFPDAIANDDVATSLACVTGLVARGDDASIEAVVGGLRRYTAVVLDLQRFDRPRPERADADRLLDALEAGGLGKGRIVIDLGADGLYAHFEPQRDSAGR